MRVIIEAVVHGVTRRNSAATDTRPAATYAQVAISTEQTQGPDVVGHSVSEVRMDPKLFDMFRSVPLPSKFLLYADQRTYGKDNAMSQVVVDAKPAGKALQQAA